MKKQLLITSVVATLIVAPTAFAANAGGYVGAGVGGTTAKDFPSGATFDAELAAQNILASSSADDTDTGWKLFGGYKFNQYLAAEGSYANFGKQTIDSNVTSPFVGTIDTTWKAQALAVSGVGILPLAYSIDLFGKLGLQYWKVDLSSTPSVGAVGYQSESEKGTDYIFGVGAGYNVTNNIAVRAEWERYNNIGDTSTTRESDMDMWSLGVQYSF